MTKRTDERHVCTKEDPWTPEKGDRAVHPEGDGCYDGCCADYLCPVCGHRWRSELPQ